MTTLTYPQAVVMGLIQGVAELFPISSLGHSLLVPALLGGSWAHLVTDQQGGHSPFLAFVVALHVATALALICHYRRDWAQVARGAADLVRDRGVRTPGSRLVVLLVAGTVPVGVIGLVAEHPLRALFATPLVAAVLLAVNGLVLLAAEVLTTRARNRVRAADGVGGGTADGVGDAAAPGTPGGELLPSPGNALLIGGSQALALLPGISRSGVTISAGLLRGLDHASATRFAFLLATPIILAAGVLKIPELFGPEAAGIGGQVLAGSAVAFVSAYAAVSWLTRYLRSRTLYPFVVYCLVAGVLAALRLS